MDEISSAEFRKVYAKLTELTAVTVHGHVIGVWAPGVDARMAAEMSFNEGILPPQPRPVTPPSTGRFNTRPFTPVPKKGK